MTAGGNRGFDARVAHPARVYDYWLGGKGNFEPGVVKVTEWRPASASEAGGPTSLWGGVGRKP